MSSGAQVCIQSITRHSIVCTNTLAESRGRYSHISLRTKKHPRHCSSPKRQAVEEANLQAQTFPTRPHFLEGTAQRGDWVFRTLCLFLTSCSTPTSKNVSFWDYCSQSLCIALTPFSLPALATRNSWLVSVYLQHVLLHSSSRVPA